MEAQKTHEKAQTDLQKAKELLEVKTNQATTQTSLKKEKDEALDSTRASKQHNDQQRAQRKANSLTA